MAALLNQTDTSTLATLLPAIITEAMFMANELSIMRGLVRNFSIPAGQGKTVTVPKYPTVTASPVTEGDEVTMVPVSTSSVTLTVSTIGVRAFVTDLARVTAQANVVADIGRLFGEAIARKLDKDLLALFSGFSVGVGTASPATAGNMNAALIAEALAKLRAGSVPADALACVVHPYVAYDLKKDMTNTFSNPNPGIIQNQAMTTGYVGQLFGVPIFESANLENNGTAGDYVGAVFHRDALGLALVGDMMLETQRVAARLGDEIVASMHYAVGELHDAYGVKITADSSIV